MNKFGSETVSAAKALDVLTVGIREGTLAPDSLAGALPRNLALASSLSIKIEELVGLYAALSKGGLEAAEIGTQVTALLRLLARSTPDQQEALLQIGLPIEDLRESSKTAEGLFGVLRTIKTSVGDDAELISRIFPDLEGLRGFLDLTGKGVVAAQNVMVTMQDHAEASTKAFSIMKDRVSFYTSAIVSNLEVVSVQLGEIFAPVINRILVWIRGFTTALAKAPYSVKVFGAGLLSIFPILFTMGFVLKLIALSVTVLTSSWLTWLKLSTAVRFQPLVKALRVLFTAIRLLGIASAPVAGLVVLAIAAGIRLIKGIGSFHQSAK